MDRRQRIAVALVDSKQPVVVSAYFFMTFGFSRATAYRLLKAYREVRGG